MTEQLTLDGERVAACKGCGAPRPEGRTAAWSDVEIDRCRACRIAAGEELVLECDSCLTETFEAELYSETYFLSPFDDEATDGEARVCQDCWDASDGLEDGLFWCDGCSRQITESRGHHMHYRVVDAGMLCLACVEDTLRREGIAGFEVELEALFTEGRLFGMFFNIGDLEAAGWTGHGYRTFIDREESAMALAAEAKRLHEEGRLIIIGYESLAIGGSEGYVTLFSREAT